MLTKDLLRYRIVDGVVEPRWLKPTPAVRELAQRLIDHWTSGVGRRRGDLEDEAMPILHGSRALLVGRGLQKVVLDACRFADPASAEALRERALAVSAAAFAAPAASADAHRIAVAASLGTTAEALAEGLYADLPDRALLEAVEPLDAVRLIAACNLGLAQGLLLHARELRVELDDRDVGLRRRLLKALRWRQLLADVTASPGDGPLVLVISGPASVVEQSTRYGMQLAQFLPALCCARSWRASAPLRPPKREGGEARLELSSELALPGDSAFLGHVPPELADAARRLGARKAGWSVEDAGLLPMPGGELVVPDWLVRTPTGEVAVELFHRWHATALARRLDQLGRGLAPRLAIGVDRALAKTTAAAPLLAHPAFARHGFLFSDLPAPGPVAEVVERLLAPA